MTKEVLVIDFGSKGTPAIQDLVRRTGLSCEVVSLRSVQPFHPPKANGYILSGGPHLVSEHNTKPLVNWSRFLLSSLSKPTLGICLGHQLIGIRFRAKPFRGWERRGIERVRVLNPSHPLFTGLSAEAEFCADHTEGIPLPDGFELLASSTHYEVEAMAHQTLPLFGVQFHPESSGEAGEMVIRNFSRLVLNYREFTTQTTLKKAL